jgi:Holliday junction resolvase RusA-like endonuclease
VNPITFNIPIAPKGKERPRVTRHGTFMPKAYEAWRAFVRWHVRSQVPNHLLPLLPLTGLLTWEAVYSVPKGFMRPDGDNADGAMWDAIQVPQKGGWGLIADDKQFRKWSAQVIAGPTRITFTLRDHQ